MIEKLKNRFKQSAGGGALSDGSELVRAGVAALIVSAARADADFPTAEREAFTSIAEKKLGLTSSTIATLIEDGSLDEEIGSAVEAIRRLGDDQREQILAMVWATVGADQIASREESAFAARLRMDLNLSLEQSLRARKLAEGFKIDSFKELVESSPEVIQNTAAWLTREKK